MNTLLSLLSLAVCFTYTFAVQQSVGVEGYLTCNGQPYKDAKVKLYDKDTFTIDDKLAETTTDARGHFQLTGTGNEMSNLNTKFNIYHRCGMTVNVCYYKNSFRIPSQYVTVGSTVSRIYNAQTIELSLLDKSRDCIN